MNAPSSDQLARAVTAAANDALDKGLEKIENCVAQLSDEQIWWRPQPDMNSIGNLLLHLTGNARQWLVSGLGAAPDIRERPREFNERGPIPKAKLLADLKAVISEAKPVIAALSAADLLTERTIQSSTATGVSAIFKTLPHFHGHTQEIINLTRTQLGEKYKFHFRPKYELEAVAAR